AKICLKDTKPDHCFLGLGGHGRRLRAWYHRLRNRLSKGLFPIFSKSYAFTRKPEPSYCQQTRFSPILATVAERKRFRRHTPEVEAWVFQSGSHSLEKRMQT